MRRAERETALRRLAAEGLSQTEAAASLGLYRSNVSADAKRWGIKFVHGNSKRKEGPNERAVKMAELFRVGHTLQDIGQRYGVSRERVRQIITGHFGLRSVDGGLRKRASAKRKSAIERRNRRCLAKHGCTFDQWSKLRRMPGNPLRSYSCQKGNARTRGIGWGITLWEWWCIWQQSGFWSQRGRGQGYVMCRYGDVGPYAVGNVFIAPATENCSNRKGKTSGLPIGVSRDRGRFVATRCLNGKRKRLGSFPTPDLAHAAYLAAASSSQSGAQAS